MASLLSTSPVYTFDTSTPNLAAWQALAQSSSGSIGFATLLHAVRASRVSVTIVAGHRAQWTPRTLRAALPTIVVISDDNDHLPSRNPNEWRCAMSAIAWAHAGFVHAAAAQVVHYTTVIAMAEMFGRMLLIETDSVHAAAWCDAVQVRHIPWTGVRTAPSVLHPSLSKPTASREVVR